ncbi:MAG: DUF3108 domain-containing protein [Azospirillum sp.]|nr:DUF3108 domain-containing protein [Azospirillum sp.]MCZ8124790.1 DUF3108 domain-containing protein [Magnetospirillum sp.]
MRALPFLAVLLAATPAAAFTTAGERIELTFDVTAGARVAEMTLAYSATSQGYEIATSQRSTGLLEWIVPWRSTTEVAGLFRGPESVPVSYRSQGTFRGNPRKVELFFEEGAVVRMETVPENRDDDRDEVPAELRAGALDPVSAILATIRKANDTGSCAARVPVFDGRQRYDIVFEDMGVRDVPRHHASAFQGAARACEFHWVPIAGRKRNVNVTAANDRRGGVAYMAPIGVGNTQAPVRIEFHAWFGTVTGHLREIRRVPSAAQAR